MTFKKEALLYITISIAGALIDTKFSLLLLSIALFYTSCKADKAKIQLEANDILLRVYQKHFTKQLWRCKNGKTFNSESSKRASA